MRAAAATLAVAFCSLSPQGQPDREAAGKRDAAFAAVNKVLAGLEKDRPEINRKLEDAGLGPVGAFPQVKRHARLEAAAQKIAAWHAEVGETRALLEGVRVADVEAGLVKAEGYGGKTRSFRHAAVEGEGGKSQPPGVAWGRAVPPALVLDAARYTEAGVGVYRVARKDGVGRERVVWHYVLVLGEPRPGQ